MSARFSVVMGKFLQNPAVAVIQASSILHCINEYAFGITMVSSEQSAPVSPPNISASFLARKTRDYDFSIGA